MGEANFRFVLWEGVRRNATRSVARGAISPIAAAWFLHNGAAFAEQKKKPTVPI